MNSRGQLAARALLDRGLTTCQASHRFFLIDGLHFFEYFTRGTLVFDGLTFYF